MSNSQFIVISCMFVSCRRSNTLCGHWDFSFASAWNLDNQTFATGNQDRTCRVWDIRNLSKSVAVLHGNMAAMRCIHYTSDGKFMVMSESTDFLHIFDVASGYMRRKEVEFYGEVSGMSFSPDSETLFLARTSGITTTSWSSVGSEISHTSIHSCDWA
jgi:WD40 repeat protein